MPESYVKLPPDSTGKELRAISTSVGGNTRYMEVVILADENGNLLNASTRILVTGDKEDFDGSLNYFLDDEPITGGAPTKSITLTPSTVTKFMLTDVKVHITSSNSANYRLYLLENNVSGTASANILERRSDIVFDSIVDLVPGKTHIFTMGDSSILPTMCTLANTGTIYYMIDWDASPGTVTGFLHIRGVKLT
ncbi:MAG: hypothetical protein ACTSVD_10675 [Candidatus Thorarchaeota archaeon]